MMDFHSSLPNFTLRPSGPSISLNLAKVKGTRSKEVILKEVVLMPGSPKKVVSRLLHKLAIFIGSSKISPTLVSLGN